MLAMIKDKLIVRPLRYCTGEKIMVFKNLLLAYIKNAINIIIKTKRVLNKWEQTL